MSTNKVVLFTAYGRTVPALVLASRSGEASHLGSSDEPLLTLALIDPARETGLGKDKDGNFIFPVGRLPQVFIEHDVVHDSHEFSDDFWRGKRIAPEQVTDAVEAAHRGNGEYSEYIPEEAKEFVGELRDRISSLQSQVDKAVSEANSQKARADLAGAQLAQLRKDLETPKAPPSSDSVPSE